MPALMRSHRKTARPGEAERFEQEKVLVKDTSTDFACAFDDSHYYAKDLLIVVARPDARAPFSLRALAGLLNSKLLKFYYRTTFQTVHVQNGELASLPLPLVDGHSRQEAFGELDAAVEKRIRAERERREAETERDKEFWARRCRELDEHIDELVYRLYLVDKGAQQVVAGVMDAIGP